ncbi:type II toxin-antitoxin system VapC family toxin [Patescibacteria group bacterium]|nr:type II toxin-antitoxin system VapC family toxin [Patescibacteria group bacterium]
MPKQNYLLDTCIIIDALRGHLQAVNFLDKLNLVNISVVTQAELLEGCRNKTELRKIKKLLEGYRIFYLNKEVCTQSINILEVYYLKHGILFDDALIASSAIINNLTLATTEKKHFRPIEGLMITQPY